MPACNNSHRATRVPRGLFVVVVLLAALAMLPSGVQAGYDRESCLPALYARFMEILQILRDEANTKSDMDRVFIHPGFGAGDGYRTDEAAAAALRRKVDNIDQVLAVDTRRMEANWVELFFKIRDRDPRFTRLYARMEWRNGEWKLELLSKELEEDESSIDKNRDYVTVEVLQGRFSAPYNNGEEHGCWPPASRK